MTTFGESPMGAETPADWRDKVMHATLMAGDQVLQGSDGQPQHYHKPQGISIALSLSDAAEADRIFAGLAENGTVSMPIQETFWAERFGMLVDQFGIPWMINCEKAAA